MSRITAPRPVSAGPPSLPAALLLSLLGTLPVAAQTPEAEDAPPRWEGPDVRGTVVELATGAPLVGAEIAVVNLDRRTFTDEGGRFLLPDLAVGENVLVVRHLGYEDLVRALVVDEEAARTDEDVVLEVVMEPRPVVLEGLEIMGDKFESRVRAAPVSTRVLGPDEIRRSSAVTALDLLRQRSGVNVGRCPPSVLDSQTCLLRYGRRFAPELLVDEVPIFWGLDELEHFPAHDVYRIEVYDGRHIRLYTVDWMRRASVERPRLPYIRFQGHGRSGFRSSRGPGWQ